MSSRAVLISAVALLCLSTLTKASVVRCLDECKVKENNSADCIARCTSGVKEKSDRNSGNGLKDRIAAIESALANMQSNAATEAKDPGSLEAVKKSLKLISETQKRQEDSIKRLERDIKGVKHDIKEIEDERNDGESSSAGKTDIADKTKKALEKKISELRDKITRTELMCGTSDDISARIEEMNQRFDQAYATSRMCLALSLVVLVLGLITIVRWAFVRSADDKTSTEHEKTE